MLTLTTFIRKVGFQLAVVIACSMGLESARADHTLGAVSVGPEQTQVTHCADTDPLKLTDRPEVKKAIAALRIAPAAVSFKGCSRLGFSARQLTDASSRYVVTYPTEVRDAFLAPVLHELAHVVQMQTAGGLAHLRDKLKESKRVELGADYLAGVMFSKIFPDAPLREFEQNILLTGLYVEEQEDAHGTPEQRMSAFRRGVFEKLGDMPDDFSKLGDHFQRNVYGQVVQ